MHQLYEFSVILQERKDKENVVVEEAQVIVPVTTVLATSAEQAQLKAGRAIPEEFMDRLERITLVTRNF